MLQIKFNSIFFNRTIINSRKSNLLFINLILILFINIFFIQLPFKTVECFVKRKELAPKIVSLKPNNITILAKGDAIFECNVISYPLAQITWKKNNKKLSDNNKKFRIIHGSNVSFLRVTDASYSLNNILNITCFAENYHGYAESTVYLHVLHEKEKPRKFPFISISNPKSVEPDTLFKIECNVTCLTQTNNIQWYQSNRPINFESEKYFTNFTRLENDTYRHILYVKGLSLTSDPLTDSMEIDFLCAATNSFGTYTAETSIMLRNRLMPPSFIAPKRSLIELEYGSSINITCSANGMPRPRVRWLEAKPETPISLNVTTIYFNSIEIEWKPGGISDILYYLVKYRQAKIFDDSETIEFESTDYNNQEQSNEYDDNDDFISINTTNTKLKVGTSLKPYTLYEFKVMAINLLGRSKPTDPLVVRTAATKPGQVKNIRFTYESDTTFTLKCDEPEDPNGELISFKIYHTDQVTNPIKNWNFIQVPISEMPYTLKIKSSKPQLSGSDPILANEQDFYYVRMSAVNKELGEGPFSNIIELKKLDKKFEPPYNFEALLVNSTYALIKWNYNLDLLKHLYRQNNNNNPNSHHQNSNLYRSLEENEIIKNLNFEIYLKEKLSDQTKNVDNYLTRRPIKSFRNVQAYELIKQIGLKRHHQSANSTAQTPIKSKNKRQLKNFLTNHLPFEYNLTKLQPNTVYTFEVAARLFNMESHLSESIKFKTLPKPINQHADKCK